MTALEEWKEADAHFSAVRPAPYRYRELPPYEDAFLKLTDGQKSALATLEACGSDHEARESVMYWIRAWDRALGRDDTLGVRERIQRAQVVWAGQLFENGGGI